MQRRDFPESHDQEQRNTMPGAVRASTMHPQNVDDLVRGDVAEREKTFDPEYRREEALSKPHEGVQHFDSRAAEEEQRRSVPLARATDSWSSLAFAGYEAGIEPLRDFTYVGEKDEIFTYKRDTGETLHFQDHNRYAHRETPGEGPIYEVSYYADPDGKITISPAEAVQLVAASELKVLSVQQKEQVDFGTGN